MTHGSVSESMRDGAVWMTVETVSKFKSMDRAAEETGSIMFSGEDEDLVTDAVETVCVLADGAMNA